MGTLYGGVFDFGIALATNPTEMKYLMGSGKHIVVKHFADASSAYHKLKKKYIERGFEKYDRPLPLPDEALFLKYKFYTCFPCFNDGKPRFFAVYDNRIYAIIDSVEIAAEALFAPNAQFVLQEFETKDEAFYQIYMYYAVQGGMMLPYCNGAPLPVITRFIKLNVFYPSPLVEFFRKHLRLPE